MLNAPGGDLDPPGEPQLAQHVDDVIGNCPAYQDQPVGDLIVREPAGHQDRHFQLTPGETPPLLNGAATPSLQRCYGKFFGPLDVPCNEAHPSPRRFEKAEIDLVKPIALGRVSMQHAPGNAGG